MFTRNMPTRGYFQIPMLITIVLIIIIIPGGTILITTNNYFGTANLAYGQLDQINSNNITNSSSLNIQNIPVKKVHVGDIDIAYKTFGKGSLSCSAYWRSWYEDG